MIVLWAGFALAAEPVLLDQVLSAVDARIPQLTAAEAKIAAAEGKLLASRGAFDPTLVGKGGGYGGPYAREVAEVGVGVQSALGPSLEVGWAYGQGEFPAYDGDRLTGSQGEAVASVTVPLLQGLVSGADRMATGVAEAAVRAQQAEAADKRLELRRKATEAWWKWAAAGARLGLERGLLEVAESRQLALERQVSTGALPQLDALDHQRAVKRRAATVVGASLDVHLAAQALSLWYRDAEGRPIVPGDEQLPPLPRPAASPADDPREVALARRPDLQALNARSEAAALEVRAAGNLRLPAIDALGEVRAGLGADAKTETLVGLAVKAPLLQRKGRGARDAGQANLAAVAAEQEALTDQIRAEVVAAVTARDASAERAALSWEAAELAREVARLEQRGFELGASDLFRVLAREATLAESAREALADTLAWGLAVAAFDAVVAAP